MKSGSNGLIVDQRFGAATCLNKETKSFPTFRLTDGTEGWDLDLIFPAFCDGCRILTSIPD